MKRVLLRPFVSVFHIERFDDFAKVLFFVLPLAQRGGVERIFRNQSAPARHPCLINVTVF